MAHAKATLEKLGVTARFVKEQLEKMENAQLSVTDSSLSSNLSGMVRLDNRGRGTVDYKGTMSSTEEPALSWEGSSIQSCMSPGFEEGASNAALNYPGAICVDDFVVLQALGQGASGSVFKVQHKETRRISALKVIPKAKLCGLEIDAVYAEQRAMRKVIGVPGILQLEASFEDTCNFYLLTVSSCLKHFALELDC